MFFSLNHLITALTELAYRKGRQLTVNGTSSFNGLQEAPKNSIIFIVIILQKSSMKIN